MKCVLPIPDPIGKRNQEPAPIRVVRKKIAAERISANHRVKSPIPGKDNLAEVGAEFRNNGK